MNMMPHGVESMEINIKGHNIRKITCRYGKKIRKKDIYIYTRHLYNNGKPPVSNRPTDQRFHFISPSTINGKVKEFAWS